MVKQCKDVASIANFTGWSEKIMFSVGQFSLIRGYQFRFTILSGGKIGMGKIVF